MQDKQASILILFCIWFLTSCAAPPIRLIAPETPISAQSDQSEFSSPEAAITIYFAGIAQADPEQILRACAINEMSENFDHALSIDRLQAFLPIQSLAPSDDPFYVEINRMQLSSQILMQVKMFTYGLLSREEVDSGAPILKMDGNRVEQFRQDVNPERLAAITIEQIDLPGKALMQNARYVENAAQIARTYGADEMTERIVLFTFEGNSYILGFTLLRYGESWKISNANSALAGTSALGVAQQTTAEEFEALANQ